MANKISGKIVMLSPTQTLTSNKGNQYDAREFVIERMVFDRNTGFPTCDAEDTPIFKLMGENCKMLDNFKIGDEVTVDYDLSGRKYEKDNQIRYFNDIRVFRVELRKQTPQAPVDPFSEAPIYNNDTTKGNEPMAQQPIAEKMVTDDLPF